ncbi:MAG: monovalent cation:proton antiporter-2 (CPA2) family protein [Gammaproteobacteria bacterium]|nr:monovalent cation:proton antiporter-2 (CPA2) family protein [Gammaproteobacteria bacterium]MDH3447293.1 monovalent cation:proton antiporter-2 (CPA2) family protein [Gammaproteobacteria bacterium]
MTGYFIQAFIYLCAAVIAVPLAKRFGLGSVLGYLIAGVVIGPVVGLVGDETATLQHFAEFGVVMMLFLVGLELEPRMLWSMRNRLLGLGGLQVGLTSAAITLVGMLFGVDWRIALTVGMILALSSTAIVLQTLNEKGLTRTEGGRGAFAVLLFQDIVVIPMLALIPLLEIPELAAAASSLAEQAADSHGHIDLVSGLPNWVYALVVLGAIATVVLGGFYLSRPLFRFVAQSRLREVFTATALMLVIGIAALMSLVGLSPALGAFLAGVVLANSEFRHELETNIEPFKGLLLGLFFITVGAGIDFQVLAQDWMLVTAIVIAVILVKAVIVYGLAMTFGIGSSDRWLVTLGLAQAGEFGFVLLSYSLQNHVIPADIAQLLGLVVAISMFLTPALFIFFDKFLVPRFAAAGERRPPDVVDKKGRVLIAGIGRFGQIVNRLLVANGIETVVLDHDAGQVDNMRKLDIRSFFGDATRPDLLETAGIEAVDLFVIAIDDRDRAVDLVHYIKQRHPRLAVLARAFDQVHYYRLRQAGADFIIKETYHAALDLGCEALTRLGFHPFRAEQLKHTFVATENEMVEDLYQNWLASEETGMRPGFRELFMQQEAAIRAAMQADRSDRHSVGERGWNPPPRNYLDEITDSVDTAD